MQMNGNTILITGGGSGIGRALAQAFHELGNQVVVAGRRPEVLDELTAAHPGMRSVVLDIGDPEAIQAAVDRLTTEVPALNVVIHNAGIMRAEDLTLGRLDDAEATVATNLLGPIRLNAALMPHLLSRPQAAILTVSSGLAFVPMAATPTYSATKAAVHAYTQALRYQLRGRAVQVIELVPPYVQTELMGERQAQDPLAMPLDEYIRETLDLLRSQPDAAEILVERVKPLRFAAANGDNSAFFERFNDASSGH